MALFDKLAVWLKGIDWRPIFQKLLQAAIWLSQIIAYLARVLFRVIVAALRIVGRISAQMIGLSR